MFTPEQIEKDQERLEEIAPKIEQFANFWRDEHSRRLAEFDVPTRYGEMRHRETQIQRDMLIEYDDEVTTLRELEIELGIIKSRQSASIAAGWASELNWKSSIFKERE